jgi:hypothetical protein
MLLLLFAQRLLLFCERDRSQNGRTPYEVLNV